MMPTPISLYGYNMGIVFVLAVGIGLGVMLCHDAMDAKAKREHLQELERKVQMYEAKP